MQKWMFISTQSCTPVSSKRWILCFYIIFQTITSMQQRMQPALNCFYILQAPKFCYPFYRDAVNAAKISEGHRQQIAHGKGERGNERGTPRMLDCSNHKIPSLRWNVSVAWTTTRSATVFHAISLFLSYPRESFLPVLFLVRAECLLKIELSRVEHRVHACNYKDTVRSWTTVCRAC